MFKIVMVMMVKIENKMKIGSIILVMVIIGPVITVRTRTLQIIELVLMIARIISQGLWLWNRFFASCNVEGIKIHTIFSLLYAIIFKHYVYIAHVKQGEIGLRKNKTRYWLINLINQEQEWLLFVMNLNINFKRGLKFCTKDRWNMIIIIMLMVMLMMTMGYLDDEYTHTHRLYKPNQRD